jgi:hypothetical protein
MIKLIDILNEIKLNMSWEDFIKNENVNVQELKTELRLNSDSLKKLYVETLNKLNNLKFPLTIYRALSIDNTDQINYNNLGNHWTFDKNSAEPYYGDYPNGVIILEGKVLLQDIDIITTIAYNMLIPHENEIYVTNPHNIKQVKIFSEIKKLNESKQVGILYHWTKLKNLKKIIETNRLNTSYAGHGTFDYVSTTRSKDKSQFGISEQSDVALVLDGNKISNNYKITPYHDIETEEYDDITYRDEQGNQIGIPADDWEGEGTPKIKKYGAFDEMEELIHGPLYPLNKYLIKIILHKTNPEIELLLKEKNIPYTVS